ncbi:MAG: phospho-N-acetylmuramoyl-pentapeptide-transferase [Armatimonadetes bacterium]|nr:phospho-N-acetylmuramoyl-pentapeptide-transferase [Armatimonadota bacterium]
MRGETVLIVLPFAAAFIASVAFGPGVIAMLKRRGARQVISEDGPESHRAKEGTPTMGGLIIIAGVLAGVLTTLFASRSSSLNVAGLGLASSWCPDVAAVLLLTLAYATVGMVDDYLTMRPVRGVRGIASRPKAAVQTLLAVAFVIWLALHRPGEFLPVLMVGGQTVLGGIPYWFFSVLYIVGMANFINITDGLDGLASGLTIIACSALIACLLLLPGGVRSECDLALFALLPAIAGACLAFLWFNANPAKVFMGDTGSMAIGAALPAIAILMHREVLMIVVGLVFVLDGLSSAIQWAVFKYTRITTGAGRRIFKKSPVHHHFELSNWPEQTVVVRFWIMGAVAALIGFAGAVWRLW